MNIQKGGHKLGSDPGPATQGLKCPLNQMDNSW